MDVNKENELKTGVIVVGSLGGSGRGGRGRKAGTTIPGGYPMAKRNREKSRLAELEAEVKELRLAQYIHSNGGGGGGSSDNADSKLAMALAANASHQKAIVDLSRKCETLEAALKQARSANGTLRKELKRKTLSSENSDTNEPPKKRTEPTPSTSAAGSNAVLQVNSDGDVDFSDLKSPLTIDASSSSSSVSANYSCDSLFPDSCTSIQTPLPPLQITEELLSNVTPIAKPGL